MKICTQCHEALVKASAQCPACGASMGSVPVVKGTELSGTVIEGKYELTEFVGEGGMAWIYRGQQRALGRQVAIKLMKPSASTNEARTRRFIREATTAARLIHPHIVLIIDAGVTPGGLHFIISEFVPGRTLAYEVAEHGQLPLPRAVFLLNQIFAGVQEAHDQGVVHRDLKPENIMITRLNSTKELAKVLDFGIACVDDGPRITGTGEIIGTPAYMAPEQIRGQELGVWTDVYALGVLTFELLTGQLPFEADSVQETLKLQLFGAPPSILDTVSVKDLPPRGAALVRQAMAKERAERFASVAEYRDALFATMPRAEKWLASCHSCHQRHKHPLRYTPHRLTNPHQELELEPRPVDPSGTTAELGPPQRVEVPPTLRVELADVVRPLGALPLSSDGAATEAQGELAPAPWLVGRATELNRLDDFLGSDEPSLELVGPAGAGKTSLLAELARVGQQRGLRVVSAGVDPWLTRAPWYPVRRLVAVLLDLHRGITREDLQQRVLEPGLVPEDLPGLLALFNLLPDAEQDVREVRFREAIFASLSVVRRGASSERTLCVVLDDVDDYDSASRRFVIALGQQAAQLPGLKVVAASRAPLDIEQGARLQVGALDQAGVESLLLRRPGPHRVDDPVELASQLLQRTGGIPLVLDQALRLRVEAAPPPEQVQSLAQVVADRLALLAEPARLTLRLLSLLGRACPPALLRQVLEELDQQTEDLEQIVGALGPAGLVGRYASGLLYVSHPCLADLIADALDPADRAELHRAIGRVLERQGADLLVRARHAFEAHQGQASMEAQEAAGDLVSRWLDAEGAGLVHYLRALHVARWELAPEVDAAHFFELSLKAGRSLRRAGHFLAAEDALKGAMDFGAPSPEQQLRVQLELARVYRPSDKSREALELLQQAVDHPAAKGSPMMVTLLRELGQVVELDQGREAAIEVLERGLLQLEAAEGAAAPDMWRLLLTLAVAHHRQGQTHRAQELTRQSLELARAADHPAGRARGLLFLGRLLQKDEPTQASELLATATSLFIGLGDRLGAARSLLWQALVEPEVSQQRALQALALARQARWSDGEQRAQALLQRGG